MAVFRPPEFKLEFDVEGVNLSRTLTGAPGGASRGVAIYLPVGNAASNPALQDHVVVKLSNGTTEGTSTDSNPPDLCTTISAQARFVRYSGTTPVVAWESNVSSVAFQDNNHRNVELLFSRAQQYLLLNGSGDFATIDFGAIPDADLALREVVIIGNQSMKVRNVRLEATSTPLLTPTFFWDTRVLTFETP